MKSMLVALMGASMGIAVAVFVLPFQAFASPDVAISQTEIGEVLVDDGQMTLYTYTQDKDGKSACNGPCLEQWAPFQASNEEEGDADFSIITRDDGSRQWTYRGKPLYRFNGDQAPGDTKGEGAGGAWSAARP